MPSFRHYLAVLLLFAALVPRSLRGEIHVSAAGSDTNPGTAERPLATLARAQWAAREAHDGPRKSVIVHEGTYYLSQPLRFTPEDSDCDYSAAEGEHPVVSGGVKLALTWQAFRDGIWRAETPAELAIDELFVNGQRQRMARYPNYDPNVRPYGGFSGDVLGPQRVARWSDPTGGFVHALHGAAWGGVHYRITGKNDQGEATLAGGWQNNRGSGMHGRRRFVENVFEELDAPGEWFHDAKQKMLYFHPPEGTDLAAATVECSRLFHLIELRGTRDNPVQNFSLDGLTFRHAARTFMETKEPLLRSDWTFYRGGAVSCEGTDDCGIRDCVFDQLGGNAIVVSKYNRRMHVVGCDIRDSGASGVAFVGDPAAVRNPLFNYDQRQKFAAIDTASGPQTDNYPVDCLVDDCLIRGIGLVEKQAAGVQISMSSRITVRHCSIYDASRAGINIGDGCWGGHVVEFCDVFDTVQETGDHGSFNSWGRDRFWNLEGAAEDELPLFAYLDTVDPIVLRNNRWRCDHGWDVDLDDGSSNFEIYNNVFLRGGLKLREGFHRHVRNNIAVNSTLHAHVWFHKGGVGTSDDIVEKNIWMTPYAPILMPDGKWGKRMDENLFAKLPDAEREKLKPHDCDAHSLVGDPRFLDPARGDYRVADDSPARRLGFENFPMDEFGVQSPELKAVARTPVLPTVEGAPAARPEAVAAEVRDWLGATVKEIAGAEFSALGVSADEGGVQLAAVPANSPAAGAGFQANDVIQSINGHPVKSIAELLRRTSEAAGVPLEIGFSRDQQRRTLRMEKRP